MIVVTALLLAISGDTVPLAVRPPTPLLARFTAQSPLWGGTVAPTSRAHPPSTEWARWGTSADFRRGPRWSAEPPVAAADTLPPDLAIALRVRAAGIQSSPVARGTAKALDLLAIPGSVLLAGALYGAGELRDDAGLRDLGLHSGQAVLLAGSVAGVGKVLTGRARPYESPDNPYEFELGRGFRGDRYQSFPSAHTAAAFASASALVADLTRRDRSPGIWIVPISYGAAALAGLTRIYHDEHWATDVLAGAVIGTLSGIGISAFHGAGAN